MSTPPLFTVALRDLENGPRHVQTTIPQDFLERLLVDTDVTPQAEPAARIDLTVESTDRQVLIRGDLDVTVAVPCARTLDPAVYRLRPNVFLLLSPRGGDSHRTPGMQKRNRPASAEKRAAGSADKPGDKAGAKAGSKHSSSDKHAGGDKRGARSPKGSWEEDPELGDDDAAQDTYSGDQIVLDEFLREFILLELPMVPLREDLRSQDFAASPPPPNQETGDASATAALDPRLSPLAELKARLEKKKE